MAAGPLGNWFGKAFGQWFGRQDAVPLTPQVPADRFDYHRQIRLGRYRPDPVISRMGQRSNLLRRR